MVKRILNFLVIAIAFSLFLIVTPGFSLATPVDLTNFYAEGPVDLYPAVPGINDAALYEDGAGYTLLSNDPFFNDPGIYIPPDATTLSMDMFFSTTGSDNFEVLVLDPNGGAPFFDFFHDGTIEGSGTFEYVDFSIDLAALGLLDSTIGLEYSLTANFNDDATIDAMWTINSVNINLAAPIPEPATILLLASGMAGLGVFGRKKFRSSKT